MCHATGPAMRASALRRGGRQRYFAAELGASGKCRMNAGNGASTPGGRAAGAGSAGLAERARERPDRLEVAVGHVIERPVGHRRPQHGACVRNSSRSRGPCRPGAGAGWPHTVRIPTDPTTTSCRRSAIRFPGPCRNGRCSRQCGRSLQPLMATGNGRARPRWGGRSCVRPGGATKQGQEQGRRCA